MTGPVRHLDWIQKEGVALWAKYVLLQNQISHSNNKPSIFFIQPTQYLPNSKTFTEDERRIAISSDANRAKSVRRGFELLREEAAKLKRKNVKIYDFSTIYSGTNGEIFTDDCCHVNEDGNTILAKNVIEVVKEEISELKCQ